ncbi:MAG: branched-chain amino acid ABC transporter permease [Janthinobacterium lividum]
MTRPALSGTTLAAILLVALLAAVPLLTTANTVLNFFVGALIIALAAQGWNILGGLGGQLSFGHAAFYGTGAYVSALLQLRYGVNAWAAAAAGIAAGAAVGAAIGAMVFRAGLRGSYFALVTLAFAEVLRILANAADFTGGASGLLVRLDARPLNFQFSSRASFFYVALACVAAVLALTAGITRARFGARLAAVRENEEAARALGIDVFAVKLRAMTLSAAITAAAGVLYLQYYLYIDAGLAYGTGVSVAALLAPVVGGVGTVLGPVIGAIALEGLGELTRLVAGPVPGIDQVLFGLLLVAAIAFMPGGLAAGFTQRKGAR